MRMLDSYNISIDGKDAVVIGRSNIVGKPMALSLLNRNATVTICHSKTKDLASTTKNADIVIVNTCAFIQSAQEEGHQQFLDKHNLFHS